MIPIINRKVEYYKMIEYKVEITNHLDLYQRFPDYYCVVMYQTELLVAQGFNDYKSAKEWINGYNDSHEEIKLTLVEKIKK